MKIKTVLVASLAGSIGYVLGAKAGTSRYEEIKARADQLARSQQVQGTVSNLAEGVKKSAQKLPDPVADVVTSVADLATGAGSTDDVAEAARGAADAASAAASEKADELKDKASDVADTAKAKASDAADTAKDKASDAADTAKDKASDSSDVPGSSAGAAADLADAPVFTTETVIVAPATSEPDPDALDLALLDELTTPDDVLPSSDDVPPRF
jgi:uncharacterized protein YjbJ (UPF0337 family)